VVLTLRLDDRELIDGIHTILAPAKLTAVRGVGKVHAAP
jgi:energy-coupling factor transporter transmembrane protein EcfT